MKFSATEFSDPVRAEAFRFIHEMIHTSSLTYQMFISCQGFPVLVAFLKHEDSQYAARKKLIFAAFDEIAYVYSSDVKIPTNDICRLFASFKLLSHIGQLLLDVLKDTDPVAKAMIDKILKLLNSYSQADSSVKYQVADGSIASMMEALSVFTGEQKLSLMRILKNISADSVTFPAFETADAIPKLISQLGDKNEFVVFHALNSLYGLCRLNIPRTEKAALSGIVPHLQKMIDLKSPMSAVASKMLCELVRTTKVIREELWKNGTVDFFVKMLSLLESGQEKVFKALSAWLNEKEETKRVQEVLCKPAHVEQIANVFCKMSSKEIVKLMDPLMNIVSISSKFSKALGDNKFFIVALTNALTAKNVDALNLLNELKILNSIYKSATHPKQIMTDVYPVLKQLALNATASLARDYANELMEGFDANLQI